MTTSKIERLLPPSDCDLMAEQRDYFQDLASELYAVLRAIESHLQRGAPVSEGESLRGQLRAALAKAEGKQ